LAASSLMGCSGSSPSPAKRRVTLHGGCPSGAPYGPNLAGAHDWLDLLGRAPSSARTQVMMAYSASGASLHGEGSIGATSMFQLRPWRTEAHSARALYCSAGAGPASVPSDLHAGTALEGTCRECRCAIRSPSSTTM
jgi:hypothetical protein